MRVPQERGNANAQSWSASIEATLGQDWVRLGLRQLSGMLILVYARKRFLVTPPASFLARHGFSSIAATLEAWGALSWTNLRMIGRNAHG